MHQLRRDTAINITLAGSDPEGESLTYTILEVNNATVTLNGNVATYTPDAHFNGTTPLLIMPMMELQTVMLQRSP